MFTANGIHLFSHAPEKWDNPRGKDMWAITCLVLAATMWLNLQHAPSVQAALMHF